jgi:hypothetical protein
MLSHIVPAVRDSQDAFRIVDITLGPFLFQSCRCLAHVILSCHFIPSFVFLHALCILSFIRRAC